MFLEPILDSSSKTYYEVITLSNKPRGPLSPFVRRLSFPKLSEFQSNDFQNRCLYVLLKPSPNNQTSCKYMGVEDISEIFSFLVSNGYIIEDELTRITSQFNDTRRRIVSVFSYTE